MAKAFCASLKPSFLLSIHRKFGYHAVKITQFQAGQELNGVCMIADSLIKNLVQSLTNSEYRANRSARSDSTIRHFNSLANSLLGN